MAPIPETIGDKETAANKIEPEQDRASDAIEEQSVTVPDKQNIINEDKHRGYPRRTRQPIERIGF